MTTGMCSVKGIIILMNPHRNLTQLCSSFQLHGALESLFARCFGLWPETLLIWFCVIALTRFQAQQAAFIFKAK